MIDNFEHQHPAFIAARPWVKARVGSMNHPANWNNLCRLIAEPRVSVNGSSSRARERDKVGHILALPLLGKEHLDTVVRYINSTLLTRAAEVAEAAADARCMSKMWRYLPINPHFNSLPQEQQTELLMMIPYEDEDYEEDEEDEGQSDALLFNMRKHIAELTWKVTKASLKGGTLALYKNIMTEYRAGRQAEAYVRTFVSAFSDNPWVPVETLEDCSVYEEREELPEGVRLNWDAIAANNLVGAQAILKKYQSRITDEGFVRFCLGPNAITYDYEQIEKVKGEVNAQIVERPELMTKWLTNHDHEEHEERFGFYPGCVCDAESVTRETPDAKRRRV